MNEEKCIFCHETLSSKNVYMYNKRKSYIDKCDNCTDKLERGDDMYE
ncbi:hypothetical protein LCGC14_1804190 [marine sediment metagenome]|uniref:Uncharacterized protein n=1 Tax=marine sediment metagenome TaxID=412755 RepID=A0A0F9GNL7_9ZZZZ